MFLVPLAALSAGTWQVPFFVAAATNFTPLMAPANLPSFDTAAFYNSTLAIAVGVGVGVLGMTVLPQLSPAHRTARLRKLTLRDLKRLATRRRPKTKENWDALIYARISALPDSAPPVARAEMVASLYVGEAVLRLRALEDRFDSLAPLRIALKAVSEGRGRAARRALAEADADVAGCGAPDQQVLRARAAMLALSEALARHIDFFGAGNELDAV